MNLKRLIRKFIRAESVAVILYRSHLGHLPSQVHPLMMEILHVEEIHRDEWKQCYQDLFQTQPPNARLFEWVARGVAGVLNLFGTWAILQGECLIERFAMFEYTRALKHVDNPHVTELIQRFLQDEQHHFSEMKTILN